jgi:hypothetical protein
MHKVERRHSSVIGLSWERRTSMLSDDASVTDSLLLHLW